MRILDFLPLLQYNYGIDLVYGGECMLVSVVTIGNSRGIRFPKVVLDRFSVKNQMDMEITDKAIVLTPVSEEPRKDWARAFADMHKNQDDVLEAFPDSEAFEWEW